MNKRFIGVLMFAFVVAALGGLITYRSLIKNSQPAKAAVPTVQIVLATKDLEVGAVIKEGDVQLADWAGTVPLGATSKPQDLMGRGVAAPIFAKEPVVETRLAAKGAGGGLAALIPKGMRAFAVAVNEIVGVAGFVTTGQHVDLLIMGTSPAGTNASLGVLGKTLMQNLEVLSAGQDIRKDPEGKPMAVGVVTVLCTPEQAEVLSLATSQTTIRMVLRNPLDHDIAKTPGSATKFLWEGGRLSPPADAPAERTAQARTPVYRAPQVALAPPPPPAKKEPPFVMEVISGTSKSETKFDKSREGN